RLPAGDTALRGRFCDWRYRRARPDPRCSQSGSHVRSESRSQAILGGGGSSSMVAASLLKRKPGTAVPAWGTVKGLSPVDNCAYQEALRALARTLNVSPVHLDSLLWLEGTVTVPRPSRRGETS